MGPIKIEINYGPTPARSLEALSNSKTSNNLMIVPNPGFETRSSLSTMSVA